MYILFLIYKFMKWIKLFEDFKKNNEEGTLITQDDIIKCIGKNGSIYATIIKDLPGNNPKEPLTPIDIDGDGLITVEIDGKQYNIDLNDVEKIEF
jgi:hypothetical protein